MILDFVLEVEGRLLEFELSGEELFALLDGHRIAKRGPGTDGYVWIPVPPELGDRITIH